ncbi:hypothetical protein OAS39_07760, partial [Pirellulales bacterium]|nr:hypothetical protein [Pirellulales bacterium]
LRVLGIKEGRHLFAASVDSSLNHRQLASAGLRRMPVAEFADLWGRPGVEPEAAFSVVGPKVDWSMRVWPKSTPTAATQLLRLLCRPDRIDVTCTLQISARVEESFIHRIAVPANIDVAHIAVRSLEHDEEIPIRWTRSGPEEATLFLARPLREAHEIQMTGRMSARLNDPTTLPNFRLVDAEIRQLRLRIDRARDVTVDFHENALPPQPASSEPPAVDYARVGDYFATSDSAAMPTILIRPNRTKAEAQTMITVSQDKSPAEAELTVALTAVDGLTDRITVRAPQTWSDPVLVDPPDGGLVRDRPGATENVRTIEVFLSEPLRAGEQRTIRLRGRLASTSDRRIRLPNLRLPSVHETARYVVLPPASDPLRWEWANLYRQRRLPAALAEAAEGRGVSFLVTGRQFVAEQQVRPDSLRRVLIRSAEVTATIDPSGHAIATCRYLLQPGAVTSCQLHLEDHGLFIDVTAGGRTVSPSVEGGQRCEFALSPPLMPIEIVARYRQELAWTRDGFAMRLPRLEIAQREVPTPSVRWRITPAEGLEIVDAVNAASIDPRTFDVLGRSERRQAVHVASLIALQLPNWEAKQWYRQWQPVVHPLPTAESAAASPEATANIDSDSDLPKSDWELLRDRFEIAADEPAAVKAPKFDIASWERASCFVSEQNAIELRIARDRSWPQRWFLAIVGAAIVVASRRWPDRTADVVHQVRDHWPWFAAAFGVLLWALVRPSIFVVVIVLAIAAAAIRRAVTKRIASQKTGPMDEPGE